MKAKIDPGNFSNLVEKTISELRARESQERREFAKGYYPTHFEVIGVTVPDIKSVAKALWSEVKKQKPEEIILLCKYLVASEIHECQQVAYTILSRKTILKNVILEDLPELELGLDNWVSIDFYAMKILGVLWNENRISTSYFIDKAQSGNEWQQRLALASTVALNLKSSGNPEGAPDKTFTITELIKSPSHDLVVKALSWSLRELGKRNPVIVLEYVALNQEELPKKVVTEVRKRLENR